MFIYAPNGMVMKDWTPAAAGGGYEMTPILNAFAPYRQDMLVLTGLMDHNGNALGDGGGDHARAGGSFLTGIHPAKTAGKDIHAGISVDQVAADAIGSATRAAIARARLRGFAHRRQLRLRLQLRLHQQPFLARTVDADPPETNPRAVFERLFGADDITLPPEYAPARADRKSILDFVAGSGARDAGASAARIAASSTNI